MLSQGPVGTAAVRDAWTLSQKRKGTQVLRQTKPGTASEGCRMTRLASSRTGENPAVRNEPRGWRNRGQDLMAICHDARKGRHSGSHWSKPARLRSTRPVISYQLAEKEWLLYPSGLPGTAGRGPACPVVWEAGGAIPPPTRLTVVSPPCQKPSKTLMLRSGEVETVEVHDFVPRRDEVVQELLVGVLASIDFRQGAELGV